MAKSAISTILVYLLTLNYGAMLIIFPLNRMLQEYDKPVVTAIFFIILVVYMLAISKLFIRSIFYKKYKANLNFKMVSLLPCVFLLIPYSLRLFGEIVKGHNHENFWIVIAGVFLFILTIVNLGVTNQHAND